MTLRRLQLLPLLGVLALAAGWAVLHPATLDGSADALAGAETPWLVPAVACAFLTWCASGLMLQGAVVGELPRGRLLAIAVASSAAGHLAPAGLGSAAVQARFVQKHTGSAPAATSALGLRAVAGLVSRTAILGALVSAGALSSRALHVTVLLPLTLGVLAVGGALPWTRRLLRASWRHTVEVGRRPLRLVQLVAGAAAVPLLHALTLLCVTQALDGTASYGALLAAYVAASAAAAMVPTPGGLGALDAALVGALVAGGSDAPTALAIVVAYRVITVWLPLVPGLALLGALHRRGVV